MKNPLPFLAPLALTACVLASCGDAGPARGPISGQVTVAGRPLKAGRILFSPMEPNEGPTVSARIVDGKYQLDEADGPLAGKNRVEVDGDIALALGFELDDEQSFAQRGGRRLPPNPIPPAFNRQSTLTVEILPGQPNTFDITVPAGRHVVARPGY